MIINTEGNMIYAAFLSGAILGKVFAALSEPRTHFRLDMLLFVLSFVVGIRTKPIFEESEE
jgi:uncharacterized membrane protein YbjE (DUF340 family)